jgi:hypothetical protein
LIPPPVSTLLGKVLSVEEDAQPGTVDLRASRQSRRLERADVAMSAGGDLIVVSVGVAFIEPAVQERGRTRVAGADMRYSGTRAKILRTESFLISA